MHNKFATCVYGVAMFKKRFHCSEFQFVYPRWGNISNEFRSWTIGRGKNFTIPVVKSKEELKILLEKI